MIEREGRIIHWFYHNIVRAFQGQLWQTQVGFTNKESCNAKLLHHGPVELVVPLLRVVSLYLCI